MTVSLTCAASSAAVAAHPSYAGVAADGMLHLGQQRVGLQAGIGVAHKGRGGQLMGVGQNDGAARFDRAQRIRAGAHHHVAGQQHVGLLRVDAHLVEQVLRRRHAHVTKKAPGLPPLYVRAVLRAYAFVRPELPWYQQWCLALGIAVGTSYKTLARYDDLARLRYDPGYFELHEMFVRLLFDQRKTHHEGGMHIDVARPADPVEVGVYHALELGHRTFGGTGYVLPHVDAQGVVHRERPMPLRAP